LPAAVALPAATVSVEVAAVVPLIVVAGALHVRPLADPAIVQEKLTPPVNPLAGVTVSVEMPLLPAAMLMLPLLSSVNEGTADCVTVTGTVVDDVTFPVAASDATTVAV